MGSYLEGVLPKEVQCHYEPTTLCGGCSNLVIFQNVREIAQPNADLGNTPLTIDISKHKSCHELETISWLEPIPRLGLYTKLRSLIDREFCIPIIILYHK